MKNICCTNDVHDYVKALAIGLFFCLFFWIVETLFQVYVFHSGSIFSQLFPVEAKELSRRLLTSALLFLCSLNVAYFFKQKVKYFSSSTFLYDVLNSIGNATLLTNDENKIVYINPQYTKLTGYTLEEVVGKNPSILNSGKHGKAFYKELWETLNSTGYWEGEIWNRRKSGELFPEWINISVITNQNDKHLYYLAIFSDITHKKKVDEKMAHYAFHDPLTNLPNRRFFIEQLEQTITLAKRNQQKIAVLFVDLDKFKQINDQFGHTVGDIYLCEVANIMKNQLRESDIISRFGGDEFVIQLFNIKSKETASELINILSSELEIIMIEIEDYQLSIDISIGCAVYPDDGVDAQSLIQYADDRMYEVKAKKKVDRAKE
jgi:diguanylate cyclase (GGDEF)-like protein/PAS domain S-box-containing protein